MKVFLVFDRYHLMDLWENCIECKEFVKAFATRKEAEQFIEINKAPDDWTERIIQVETI